MADIMSDFLNNNFYVCVCNKDFGRKVLCCKQVTLEVTLGVF